MGVSGGKIRWGGNLLWAIFLFKMASKMAAKMIEKYIKEAEINCITIMLLGDLLINIKS